MLMFVINLDCCPLRKHIHLWLWGQHVPSTSPLWPFVWIWQVWPFSPSHSSRIQKAAAPQNPIKMPGLWLAKLAISKNSCVWSQLSSAPNHILCFVMRCGRAILEYNSPVWELEAEIFIHLFFPSLNQVLLITARWVRSESLTALMGLMPDCCFFSIKNRTAVGKTSGVIQSYRWQSHRPPNAFI